MSEQFEFLLDKVDQIHVDMFNTQIRKTTPFIRLHGVEYEKKRFSEKLESNTLNLKRTTAWIYEQITGEVFPKHFTEGKFTGSYAAIPNESKALALQKPIKLKERTTSTPSRSSRWK